MNDISVYAYCGFPITAEERFAEVKKAGFQNVAVWCNNDFNTGSGITEYEQFKFVRENGLKITYAHAPTKLAPYLSNRYYGAKEAVKTHKLWAKNAKENGIPMMIIHLPEIAAPVIDNVGEIADFCEGQGIKLAVENLRGKNPFDDLFANVKNVGFCYDTCHALMFGDADGEMAEKYADRLMCLHLSDGDGVDDRHWMIGKGKYNFDILAKKLKNIGYKGDYVLEAFQSAEYADIFAFLSDGKANLERIFK